MHPERYWILRLGETVDANFEVILSASENY